ncbi:MAG: sigma-70 family RNA polymerase sigma factor [Pseudomonadota bacterium]
MLDAEQQLIAQAQRGDVDAFSSLVEHYRDRLLRFLWLKSGDAGAAEDATQEALINAWRYLKSYNNRWQFSTWLYRIGLRQLKSAPEVHDNTATALSHDNTEFELEMDNVWRTARSVLSDDACHALWLRYAEDASIKEIAAIMERTSVWVKVNLMRSRQRLAQHLNG